MTEIKLCLNKAGESCAKDITTLDDAFGPDRHLVWINLARTEHKTLHELAARLQFHELAVEDALKGGQRPKLDLYHDQLFMVVYAMDACNGTIVTRELSLFVGNHYIVTIHDGELSEIEAVSKRWNEGPLGAVEHSKGLLLYAILDSIVDGYFPAIDDIGDQLEDLESMIFASSEQEIRQRVFALRHQLVGLRRIVSAERDVINQLLRHDMPMFSHEVSVYLTDVFDHLLRAFDWIESYRDQLATLLDLQSAAAANRLNRIMKTLTASSIILMSATLIAGIYGMNFTHMPELTWLLGYPFALGLMVVLAGVLFIQFRKRDWF